MLFRNYKGKLVELNILDFLTDAEYYKQFLLIKLISKANIV